MMPEPTSDEGAANSLPAPDFGARPRLLGLFAHPDDEVFCIGGTFVQQAALGANTMVASFTRGEAGSIRHVDVATRRTLGSVRERELEGAGQALGIETVRCFDFGDGELPRVERSELVAAAVEVIRQFKPDVVFSFDETGAYGHPDHIVMSEVSVAACAAAGVASAYPELGPPHRPRRCLHAAFPQSDQLLLGVLVSWLHSLDHRYSGSDEFASALQLFADETSMLGYASDHLSTKWFPRGSYVIEQGQPAESLYLVLAGSVDVRRESDDGTMKSLGRAGPGEFIGEIGIAANETRNAHCIAAENVACFVLSPQGSPASRPQGQAPEFSVDVHTVVSDKVAALAEHRSQYPIAPGLFPEEMMSALMGVEYFIHAWP